MNDPITKVEKMKKNSIPRRLNSIDYTYVVSEQNNKIGIHKCLTSLMQLLLAKILQYFKRISIPTLRLFKTGILNKNILHIFALKIPRSIRI